ncbi:MAG: putative ester cyclase [Polaribacter sp.]|jgi:predicted ester cyclase
MMTASASAKTILEPVRHALYDYAEDSVKAALNKAFTSDALIQLSHPFGTLSGPEALYEIAYKPLQASIPDVERRDHIVISGSSHSNEEWVACCGYYSGTFNAPWLDIPPTGHLVTMRFHEFYKVVDGQITQMQAVWDIVEVMHQANAWPLAPSLGKEWQVPGPATLDGVCNDSGDPKMGLASRQHIVDMLTALLRHPAEGGPEVMQLEKFWHPKMNWYGPSGIGTARGINGFRNWHQIPFLNAMPDRGSDPDGTEFHFIGERNYAAVTGWPNMIQTLSDGGWLGIAPNGRKISLRSLDFWRIENGLIRENWVLIDMLDIYRQLGIDVFSRLREFNKARSYRFYSTDNAS